jgi:hypothetical protein
MAMRCSRMTVVAAPLIVKMSVAEAAGTSAIDAAL